MNMEQLKLRIASIEANLKELAPDALLNAQPSGADLDACDMWIQSAKAVYANLGQMVGQLDALCAIRTSQVIEGMDVENKALKAVLSSSTLTMLYVKGKAPMLFQLRDSVASYHDAIKESIRSYMTLIASFREQRNIENYQPKTTK